MAYRHHFVALQKSSIRQSLLFGRFTEEETSAQKGKIRRSKVQNYLGDEAKV